MGEGKSEGTLRTSRPSIGQEQIDGPASIADDFNPSVNRHLPYFITFHRSVMQTLSLQLVQRLGLVTSNLQVLGSPTIRRCLLVAPKHGQIPFLLMTIKVPSSSGSAPPRNAWSADVSRVPSGSGKLQSSARAIFQRFETEWKKIPPLPFWLDVLLKMLEQELANQAWRFAVRKVADFFKYHTTIACGEESLEAL